MANRERVDREHQVRRCRARDPGDVHESVELTIELLDGGVDAAGICEVHVDVAVYGGGGRIAVQRNDFRACGEQTFGDGVADAGCGAGNDEALTREGSHRFS